MIAATLVIGGFVAFCAWLVTWGMKHAKKVRSNFQQLAAQLGFVFVERAKRAVFDSSLTATGEIDGRAAQLLSYTTGSGKHQVTWAAISLTPRADGGLQFELSRQGLGTTISRLFGAREITVGEPAFDSAWFIQTNQPDFFQAALLPELQTRITAALTGSDAVQRPSFKLESGSVVYREAGDFGSDLRCARIAALTAVLSDLAAIAEVFAQHSPPAR